MEKAATDDDTSRRDAGENGHDGCIGGGGQTAAAQDSVQSASAVTEVGSSGNAAAAEMALRPGLDDGRGEDYGRLTVVEKEAVDDDYYGPVEAEMTAISGGVPSSSPVRLAATRFGCLLLGFIAGAAAAVLFLMRHDSPMMTTCTVVPT